MTGELVLSLAKLAALVVRKGCQRGGGIVPISPNSVKARKTDLRHPQRRSYTLNRCSG
jgi:hypothetical protein